MSGMRGRGRTAAIVTGGLVSSLIVLFVPGWWVSTADPSRFAVLATSWISIGAGLFAVRQRPENPIGTWLALSGACGMTAFMVGGESPAIIALSMLTYAAGAGLGCAVVMSYPTGRLDATGQRAVVVGGVIASVTERAITLASFDPTHAIAGWTAPNPLLVPLEGSSLTFVRTAFSVGGVGLLLAIAWLLARRWRGASGPARRTVAPVLAGGIAFVLGAGIVAALEGGGVRGGTLDAIRFVQTFTYGAIPVGLLVGLLRVRMARSAVADLVVELGESPDPAQLRRALATALGDASLDVLLWSKERRAYVDDAGWVVPSPDGIAGRRAVTALERDHAPLAVILHDPALLDDPGLVASVATAVRLTVENDRLQAEVEAQLAEVRASRARIVAATDAERRRIERDIHDGAQQRLVAMSLGLQMAQGKLGPDDDPELVSAVRQASDEVRAALVELRELARGIHPAILTEAGLEAAVRSLVERAPVPARLEVALDRRLPQPIEATAYFIVSEALANVGKHAPGAEACVRLLQSGPTLDVEVRDDGPGGADVTAGSGLRGLRDRVEAVGGSLEVVSPAGGGTSVHAVLPAAGDAGATADAARPAVAASR